MTETITQDMVARAAGGDRQALEQVLTGVQDLVFTLSLRMLGTVPDAQDATQEILVKIMTHLGSFRFDSEFTTWVYRISSNYLISSKKSIFAQHPLSFDFYGEDILHGHAHTHEVLDEAERADLAKELKQSCSNVMLQCFTPQDRCIFVFGTMFHLDSRIAADALNITAENYRQRLSRLRKKMAAFLHDHCGLAGSKNCSCPLRVDYALTQGRIQRGNTPFTGLEADNTTAVINHVEGMDRLDDRASLFDDLPTYKSPVASQKIIEELLGVGALDFLTDES